MSSPVAKARTSTRRGRVPARFLPTLSSVARVASVRSGDRPTHGIDAARGDFVGGAVGGSSFAAKAATTWGGCGGSSSGGGAAPKGAGVMVITRLVSVPVSPGAEGDLPFDLRRSVTVITGSAAPSEVVEGAGSAAMLASRGMARRRLSIGPGGGAGRAAAGLAGSWRGPGAVTVGGCAYAGPTPQPKTARARLRTAAEDVGITNCLSTGFAARQ